MMARALLVLALLGCHETAVAPDETVDRGFRCRTALDVPAACAACLEASCCDEAIACGEDLRCKPCVQPGFKTECDDPGPAEAWALIDCQKAHCKDVCPPPFPLASLEPACDAPASAPSEGSCVTIGSAPGVACNPVTNVGCGEGEACDTDGGVGVYRCYPQGNLHGTCELCGYGPPDFCTPRHHCVGKCARFCCSDADCGTGHCNTDTIDDEFYGDPPVAGVGVCVAGP